MPQEHIDSSILLTVLSTIVALGPEPKSIGGLRSLDCFLSIAFSRHRPVLGSAACSQASAASGRVRLHLLEKVIVRWAALLVAKASYAACAGRVRRRHQTVQSFGRGLRSRCKPAAAPYPLGWTAPISPDVSRSNSRREGSPSGTHGAVVRCGKSTSYFWGAPSRWGGLRSIGASPRSAWKWRAPSTIHRRALFCCRWRRYGFAWPANRPHAVARPKTRRAPTSLSSVAPA